MQCYGFRAFIVMMILKFLHKKNVAVQHLVESLSKKTAHILALENSFRTKIDAIACEEDRNLLLKQSCITINLRCSTRPFEILKVIHIRIKYSLAVMQ